jgi:tetratricopeptide (TPR) repeat protein
MIDIPPELHPILRIPILLLITLPCAIGACIVLHAWVMRGATPPQAYYAACLVMLVNLLAAGGISYAGVAQSLWILAALGLSTSSSPEAVASREAPLPPVRRGWMWLMAGAAALACLLCLRTGYLPVIKAQRATNAASITRSASQAAQLYEEAAAADRWSPEAWHLLAELRQLEMVRSAGNGEARQAFEQALAEAARRNRRSHGLEMLRGRLYLGSFRALGRAAYLGQSIEAFRRAVQLYPNSSITHAQLAWVLHLSGQADLAAMHAARALDLDAQNPHGEQKLKLRRLADPGPATGQAQPSGPPAETDVEQLMRRLRTTADGRG